jgi:FkbM family methyltransferase
MLLKMKRHARRYRIKFRRARGFEIPRSLLISGKRIPVKYPTGDGFKMDFIDLFLRDTYCLDIVARDKGIKQILDIGANCGSFSMVARASFPRAAISAYEPNPIVLPTLRHNVAELDIEINPVAVGAVAGSVHMEHPEGATNEGRAMTGGNIPCLAICDVLDRVRNVDLLKLDCEGSEWGILDALPWGASRWLTMEYHLWAKEGASHADVRALLGRKNFQVVRQVEMGSVGMMLARRY